MGPILSAGAGAARIDIVQLSQIARERVIHVDVLSFVDVALEKYDGSAKTLASRQLAVNGIPLQDILNSRLGHEARQSTQLVEGMPAAIEREYLRGLLGEPTDVQLPSGRIPIGWCDICFGNDGWVYAATLEIAADVVRWRAFGGDFENGFPFSKSGPWWRRRRVQPPADWEWWSADPFDPELSFTFDRVQYEAVIAAELDRIRE
jgi:hypothetical protein